MKEKKIKQSMMLMTTLVMVFVSLATVSAAGISDNAFLELSLSNYDPIPAEPGKTVDVWINLQNNGAGIANDVTLEFVDTSVFSLVSQEDRFVRVPTIGAFNDYVVKYKIMVSDNVPEGSNDLLIKYSMAGSSVVVLGKVSIDVKSTETPISINSVEINPSPLAPGGKATIKINVNNIARSSNIRNVDVVLQLTTITSGSTIVDLPFVTVNSGNEQTADRVAPGESQEFKFDIAAYPDAEAKIYKLPVTISYYDDTGREYEKTLLVGVEVNDAPDLLVNLESTDLNTKIKSGNVLFNIINKGTTNVKLMTVSLEESNQYSILSPSNDLYLGNIDSDDFETARFNVKINEVESEKITFSIKATYKDSLNKEFTENYNVEYVLREPVSEKKSSFTWIFILVIVVIGVFFWFKKRNKRKNN